LTAAAGKVLGRDTSGDGTVQELPISVTSAGNVTIPNNFAVTGTTGLTGTTTLVDLTSTGTASLTNLGVTGTTTLTNALTVPNGGTGVATLPANNVLIGNGTSAVTGVAPGIAGNVLTSDGTSWTAAAASTGAYTEYLNQSTDVTLVAVNTGKVVIDPTVSIMVQLPNATTLTEGDTFEITNISEQNNLFVKSNDGAYQAFVAAGQTVNVTVENISTAAGVWVADNPSYGLSSPVSFGFTGTYTNYAINSATAAISATKMIRINFGAGANGGLTATIITKSGAAITKGTEQSILSFNLSQSTANTGFINVVMTSATTGIISTIGSVNTGVTKVLLYTFSLSGSDVVQITGQNSFSITTGTTGKKDIGLAALSATSVMVTYNNTGVYTSRIITLTSGLITAIGNATNVDVSGTNVGFFPQIVALSSTLVVTGWLNQTGNALNVIAGTVSGSTITWGTSVIVASALNSATGTCSISRLSATEFIVTTTKTTTILSNYGSVSGTTITLGAQDTYTGGGSFLYSIMSYPISSTSALVVHYDTSGGSDKPYAFVLTKSGTSLTRGTVYVVATSPTPSATNFSPFSLKGFVAFNVIQQPATDFYMDYATTQYVFAVPLSVSGTVVTPDTGILVTPENISTTIGQLPTVCTLSKTRAIAFVYYNAAPDGTASSRLYLLDTSNARPVILATSSTISTAAVFCAGQLTATRALIAYATSSGVTPTIRTLDITGDVFTFNTSITGASNIGTRPAIRKINSTKAMLYVTQSTTDHRIYNIAISGTTLTESPSFIATSDNTNQSTTSRRLLYSYGDVGFFFQVSGTNASILMFDPTTVSPTSALTSTQTLTPATNIPNYNALSGTGVILGLNSINAAATSTLDGNIKSFGTVAPEFSLAGITLPFNANSVMVYGSSTGYYGKLAVTAISAGTSTNTVVPNQTKLFDPSLSMHDSVQDWVDGDYFIPNTSKLLFLGRNGMNLQYEMYHVFDKGAAQ
jgi:hypothetical protein